MIIKKEQIVTKEIQDVVENTLLNGEFPWYFNHGTVMVDALNADPESYKYVISTSSNPYQFVHVVIQRSVINSAYYNLVEPFIDAVVDHYKQDIEFLKAKFNFLPKSDDSRYHYPHTDIGDITPDLKSFVYYVNDSDGETYFFNEKAPRKEDQVGLTIREKVSPVKGNAVIFDADIFHCSSSPLYHDKRIVLNMVFRLL